MKFRENEDLISLIILGFVDMYMIVEDEEVILIMIEDIYVDEVLEIEIDFVVFSVEIYIVFFIELGVVFIEEFFFKVVLLNIFLVDVSSE